MLIILLFLAEAFEAYVPPEGDGKATLMSRDVNSIDCFIDGTNSHVDILEIKSILYIIKKEFSHKKTFEYNS